jgi:hypothetical protein
VPATSIDGFFACTLLVTVALVVMASFAGAMQTNINSLQGVNDQNYLKTTAEHLVCSVGSPANWGSTGMAPTSFGLAKEAGQAYELDIDKVCRLNSQCTSTLMYDEASKAARLYNLAFSVTVTQMLSITLEPTSNTTADGATTYNFQVSTAANLEPAPSTIQCYIINANQVSNVSTSTSSSGVGNFSFELLDSEPGPVLLVVFAKANLDERLTAYQTYSFTHISGEQLPQQVLSLSPLDSQLTVNITQPDTTVNDIYAFSFSHQSQLTQNPEGNYTIPKYLDKSPTVLVVTGSTSGADFIEWSSYPNVPLTFGSSFANTGQNTFVYTVTVNDVLYKLTVTLGDIA